MSLKAARTSSLVLAALLTSSLPLSAGATSSLSLHSRIEPKVINLGFESDESWGSFVGSASVSAERSRSGTQALKFNASAGGAGTLSKIVGPTEGKSVSVWVYLETSGTNSTLSVFFSGIGRSVDFRESRNLNGLATDEWVELLIPNTATLGPFTNTSLIRITVTGSPAPVMFADDVSVISDVGVPAASRSSSLALHVVPSSSPSLATKNTSIPSLRSVVTSVRSLSSTVASALTNEARGTSSLSLRSALDTSDIVVDSFTTAGLWIGGTSVATPSADGDGSLRLEAKTSALLTSILTNRRDMSGRPGLFIDINPVEVNNGLFTLKTTDGGRVNTLSYDMTGKATGQWHTLFAGFDDPDPTHRDNVTRLDLISDATNGPTFYSDRIYDVRLAPLQARRTT